MRTSAFFLCVLASMAQTPTTGAAGGGAPLALVRFQVAPEKGKAVTDLRPADIEIREDGAAREVVMLQGGAGNPREIPVEVSLLFDCSRTALSSGTLDAGLFTQMLLGEFPNVSIAIYGFSPGLTRLARLTRDDGELTKALEAPLRIHPLSTFLMDHISRVMVDAASSEGAAVRIVVAVSTGRTDQGSSSAAAQQERYQRAVSIAQQANIAAYPVMLIGSLATQDATPAAAPLSPGTRVRSGPLPTQTDIQESTVLRTVGNFVDLGSVTGGRRFEVLSGGNMLPTVLKQIADDFRSEYVAGFQVSPSGEKKRHKIEVVMRNKERGRISSAALNLVY
jgi:VWFA-related protein